MAINSTPLTTDKEAVTFIPDAGVEASTIRLLVNPEQLDLRWTKVINRVRTKTRLVTFFWGEAPVAFNYRGQTGFTYPTATRRNEVAAQIKGDAVNQANALRGDLASNRDQLSKTSDPGRVAELETEQKDITDAIATLENIKSETDLTKLHEEVKTNTGLHLLSAKYRILKKLENLYRKHQDPENLITLQYRKYEFRGYFESFSFVDDARNPWNWIYNINFTILEWTDSVELDGEEIQLAPTT